MDSDFKEVEVQEFVDAYEDDPSPVVPIIRNVVNVEPTPINQTITPSEVIVKVVEHKVPDREWEFLPEYYQDGRIRRIVARPYKAE